MATYTKQQLRAMTGVLPAEYTKTLEGCLRDAKERVITAARKGETSVEMDIHQMYDSEESDWDTTSLESFIEDENAQILIRRFMEGLRKLFPDSIVTREEDVIVIVSW
jgi:hypothetical protein